MQSKSTQYSKNLNSLRQSSRYNVLSEHRHHSVRRSQDYESQGSMISIRPLTTDRMPIISQGRPSHPVTEMTVHKGAFQIHHTAKKQNKKKVSQLTMGNCRRNKSFTSRQISETLMIRKSKLNMQINHEML